MLEQRHDRNQPAGRRGATPPGAPGRTMRSFSPGMIARRNTFWIVVILVGLVAAFSALRPQQFLTVFNFQTLGIDAAVLTILSIGQTYVLITAGIDLSVGAVLVFSSIVSAKAMLAFSGAPANTYAPVNLSWALIIAGGLISVVTGLAWGVFNGWIVARTRVPALIVTLGSFGMALGLAEIISGGTDVRAVPKGLIDAVGTGTVVGVPVLVIIAAVAAVITGIVLRKTVFGRRTFAIGSNIEAARRAGIRVGRHTVMVYALCGGLAGFAGFLSLAEFTTTTLAGHSSDNLNTIAAAVIGGTSLFGGIGTILGTVVGVFIPSVLQDGFVIIGITPFWQEVAVGVILIGAVYFDTERRKRQAGQ
ncbi:MAG: ABC transporter permease [Streptosporangiaceae bacterium]